MKTVYGLVLFSLAGSVFAQAPWQRFPEQGPQQQNPQNSRTNQATAAPSASTITTETIRLLGLKSVQEDITMTENEYTDLSQLANTLPAASTTEDQAYTAVSKVLTKTQSDRLEQLLIQDLGFGSLEISDVRTKLNLSSDQTTQINALVASLQTAKQAILGMNSSAVASVQAISKVANSTDLSLEVALTADQRTKLKGMVGKTLN
jgi:hypothetical protein